MTLTALVTGANSGVGFEAVAQLALSNKFDKIYLICRSKEKGEIAREKLVERVGKDIFETEYMNTQEVDSALELAQRLAKNKVKLDYIALNAGRGNTKLDRNGNGIDVVYASTLIGHHTFVHKSIELGLLNQGCNIVFAGSEVTRGDTILPAPSFDKDIKKSGKNAYDTILSLMQGEEYESGKKGYNFDEGYTRAKMIVNWWVQKMAEKYGDSYNFYSVSPGAIPTTSFGKNTSFMMRWVMLPLMAFIGPLVGQTHSVHDGAKRYIDAAYDSKFKQNGAFYASALGKMAGKLVLIDDIPLLHDENLKETSFQVLCDVTKIGSA